jgi:predicted O-methyltransferase YrrM
MKHLVVVRTARRLALVLGCGLWVFAGPALRAAEEAPVSEEAREQFIREFKRIGLNTTPGDAMLLRILVQASGAKRGIEVGSATGYGALQMGVGFERNGGRLITIDIDPEMVRQCRANLKKAGLEKTVTVVEGDALKVLPALEGEFDFVFIDAVKRDYLKYLRAIEPKLKPGAVVVADNVIQFAREMQDYLDHVERGGAYETVIVRASMEKNDGMAISYKKR